jgi:hypothetical protein
LGENRKDELVVVFEPIVKILQTHGGVFDLPPEKGLFEKIIEFDPVEFADNENVDDTVGGRSEKVFDSVGNGHEPDVFLSFEKILNGADRVVVFQENLGDFRKNGTVLVQKVDLLLVFFAGFQNTERFEVHEFAPNRIDLFVEVPAEFANEKSVLPISGNVFYDEFFKDFGPRF